MTKNRSDTGKQRYPAFQGRLIYDTWRGQQRVRSWPRKRGPSKIPNQQIQTQWFKAANKLARIVEPSQQKAAIEATRNTGLYPRDVIIRAMGSGLIDIIEPDGTLITYQQKWFENMNFQGTVLRLATAFTPAQNIWTAIQWPLPLLDTTGMWTPAQPQRLTIPQNILAVEMIGGIKQDTGGGPLLATRIRMNGALDVAWGQATSSGSVGHGISSGPLRVVAGDFFDMLTFPTLLGPVAVGPTYFAALILATP